MQPTESPRIKNPNHRLWQSVLIALIACPWALDSSWGGLIPPQQEGTEEAEEAAPGQPSTALFAPAPRELSRPLFRAKRALRNEDHRAAVELLGNILTNPSKADYLQPLDDDPFRSVSIHHQAHELLGSIPAALRADYELRYQVTAQQLLEDAVQNADFELMAQLSRRYFYTDAGYMATMLLGKHYLESGQPVSAISNFSALLEDPAARQQFDPELSVLSALSWLLLDNTERAEEVLEAMRARYPRRGTVRVNNRQVPLYGSPDQAISWLVDLFGEGALQSKRQSENWLMFRGDASRNSPNGTGFPLTYPRWYVPTINQPRHEELAKEAFQSRSTQGESLVPALQPIAVDQTVVVRSLNKVLGIDFETGKRIWEFPAWQRNFLLDHDRQSEQHRQDATTAAHVDQRIWEDHLYGQIASNGDYVFFVERPGFAGSVSEKLVTRQGRVVHDPLGGRETNELVAVDLHREGAFCWQVGGRTGGVVPELADVFFLGPPLPLDQELYVLGELSGEIRLFVLEQLTGQLLWSQQIAAIDSILPVTQNQLRRLAGATPSHSNGVIVCPTSGTGIVAIDRSTRSLLWGVQYPPLWEKQLRNKNNRIRRVQIRQLINSIPTQSIDATLTIAEGRVITMPVESNRILCYDLLTGQSLWNSFPSKDGTPNHGRPVENDLFIGCVQSGQLLLVGEDRVRSLDLGSGEQLWSVSLSGFGRPSGRGFLAGDKYYFPTNGYQIVEVDLNQETISGSVNTRRILGNLICHRGDVISQGHDVVSVYRQAQPARRLVERSLESQPVDELPASTLSLSAQLFAQDGKLTDAVRTAELALKKSDRRSDQRLLLDLIVELMEKDYQSAAEWADRYENLLGQHRPLQYVAARFGGLVRQQQFDAALNLLAASELDWHLESDLPSAYRTVEQGAVRLRLDGWIRHQLMTAMKTPGTGRVAPELVSWAKENLPQLPARELSQLADLIGLDALPGSELIRLTRWHLDRNEFLSAERVLNGLGNQVSKDDRLAADALRSQLLIQQGYHGSALQVATQLKDRYGGQSFIDPETGEELRVSNWFDSLKRTIPAHVTADWDQWAYGEVSADLQPVAGRRSRSFRLLIYPRMTKNLNSGPDNLQVVLDVNASTLTIRDAMGATLGVARYKPETESRRYYAGRTATGKFAVNGHQLFVSYGLDLAAIDLLALRNGHDALMWHASLEPQRGSQQRVQVGTTGRAIVNPWGQNRHQPMGPDNQAISNFGINDELVFYRIGSTLNAVDQKSGQIVWQRTVFDSAHIVAEEGQVALLEPSNPGREAGKFKSAVILDAYSGARVKQVDLSAYTDHILWHQQGLDLVFTAYESRKQSLVHFNLANESSRWSSEWPRKSWGLVRDPETMVIVTPEGELQYLNFDSGEVTTSLDLGPVKFRTLRLVQCRNHDLVLLNRETHTSTAKVPEHDMAIRVISTMEPLFNGRIWCIDRRTNQFAWDQPARVEYFSIPEGQPSALPLLTLNRQVFPAGKNNIPRTTVEFYTLDLRDGRLASVVRKANWNYRTYELTADIDHQSIQYAFGDQELKFHLKENESAPTAPATLTNRYTMLRFLDETQRTSNSGGGAAVVD